jgi:hypothetical protein
MLFKKFKITAMPFPQSDLTAEFFEWASDEDGALEQFEKRYPAYRVKEVEEAAG